MDKPINLAEVTSIEQLESMAYKQILAQEQATRNIQALQQRIAQLSEETTDE